MTESPPEIKILPEIVVNRIAAGEIIHRPVNVVKELIENSLDAGATQINVTIGAGGLKTIIIQDDGCGIRLSDLEILCHRFTTSKLRQYEDLQTIATFGFRGEALASVSHVSRLTVTTRCSTSQMAFRAEYLDGNLKEKPKACAGNVGTIMKIDDLFYNVPVRRAALKSARDEYAKCLDVVSKYALNNCGVGFLLKRQNESSVDIRTNAGGSFDENLIILYGAAVAKDSISFECENASLGYKAHGRISHPNYAGKKFTFILFINGRLVDCSSLKKSLDLLSSQVLPKGNHAFVYLNLTIKSHNVDVNVHPTKLEVHFLHETLISDHIVETVERKLLTCNDSRTFYVKQLMKTPTTRKGNDSAIEDVEMTGSCHSFSSLTDKKPYDYNLIRTNFNDRKLEEFFTPKRLETPKNLLVNFTTSPNGLSSETAESTTTNKPNSDGDFGHNLSDEEEQQQTDISFKISENSSSDDIRLVYANDAKAPNWRHLNLSSVRQLEQEIYAGHSHFLRNLIREHTLVGSVDARLTLIQHKTSLYLADTTKLCEQFFYQKIIFCFGNLDMFRFKTAFPLSDLIRLALASTERDNSSGKITQQVDEICQLLTKKSEMLLDYFSIEIRDGKLTGIPILLQDFVPQLEHLPAFVLRLMRNIDYSSEIVCFKSICREIAKFYAIKREYCVDSKISGVADIHGATMDWKWVVESLLFPNFKTKLIPQSDSLQNGCLHKITDLHDLYKVFERC